jgi:hypothetical protein
VFEVGGLRLAVVVGDESVHCHSDVRCFGRVADPRPGRRRAVLRPVLRSAAEDPKEHRQAQLDGPQD